MISKWQWIVRQVTRKLWVRASLFALLGVVSALVSIGAKRFIPWEVSTNIGAEAVDRILTIIASSMLAVTTFSLNVMVAAYGSATSNVTPRATRLLMEDSTTQNALGTFIGSFLFAVVGIIALSTGSYGNTGRVVLFIVTLGVIGLIIFTLLRWIDHLSRLGRVGETTDRVEKAAFTAIADRVENPYLGGVPLLDVTRQIPANVSQICVEKIGYIQHIDMSALSALAKKLERQIYVAALPGTFVYRNRPLAWMATPGDDRSHDDIRRAFTIEDERSFDQDPRFGMIVLAEIASRALSPAVNDPGTAIDVIGRSVRLLSLWCDRSTAKSDGEIRFHNVHVPPVLIDEMFDDIYTAIAHDGASIVAVHTRLQKAFLALAQMGDERFKQSARRHSQLALKRASAALALDEDKELLNKLASDIDSM